MMLAAALVAAPTDGSVTFIKRAVANTPAVRLADVADLSRLPAEIRARAEGLVLVRFAPGQTTLRISAARLVEWARAQLPILASYLPTAPVGVVTVNLDRSAPVGPTLVSACMRVLKPIASGAAPRAGDLEPAPCGENRPRRAFAYDRTTRVARAARALSPGETIAAIPASSLAGVRAGDAYVVTARVGPVRIERHVVAVRSAQAGGRMFVVGDDGEVFATPQPAGTDQQ